MTTPLLFALLTFAAEPAKDKPNTDLHGDPLPKGAVARIGSARLRHGETVTFVAFLPDGKSLISGGADWTIRIWDRETGKQLRSWQHPDDRVISAAARRNGRTFPLLASLSRDGKLLASAVANGRHIRIWDVETGKERLTVPALVNPINSVALAPDGKSVAVNCNDSIIRLYDLENGKELKTIGNVDARERVYGSYGSMSFSPDGKLLLVGGLEIDNGAVKRGYRALSVADGKILYRLDNEQARATFGNHVAFSPDGKTLAWGDQQGMIFRADAATGKPLTAFRVNLPRVEHVVFTPDGKGLIARNWGDAALGLWDAATGKELKLFDKPAPLGVAVARPRTNTNTGVTNVLAVAPDGKTIASADGNVIRLLNRETGKDAVAATGHRGTIFQVEVLPSGKQLVTISGDGTLRRWEMETGKELGQLRIPDGAYSFALSPDGKWLVADGIDGAVRLIDVATGKEIHRLDRQVRSRYGRYAFSPKGDYLAVRILTEGNTFVYDIKSGKLTAALGKPADPDRGFVTARNRNNTALAFSPDGKLLASPTPEGGLNLWEIPSGRVFREIPLERANLIRDFAFSPDGRMYAVDMGNGEVLCYELASGLLRRKLVARDKVDATDPPPRPTTFSTLSLLQTGRSLRFSADSKRLSFAGEKNRVQVWDLATSEEIARLAGHQAEVQAMAFTPDSKRLVSASDDATALVWDVASLPIKKSLAVLQKDDELQQRWGELHNASGARAFEALCELAGAETAPKFLAERLKPAAPPNAEQIEQWIDNLDARRYTVREKATQQLALLGRQVLPLLEKELAGNPSEEARKRLEELIENAQRQNLAPAQLQILRGIEALERAGTKEAKAVLEKLAAGAPGALETAEAAAVLARWR